MPIPAGSLPKGPHLATTRVLPPWPGHGLRPLLEGSAQALRDRVLIGQDTEHLRARTLVTERYRITCYAGQEYGELLDLQKDPKELYNLWADLGRRSPRNELLISLLDEVLAGGSFRSSAYCC